MSLVISAVAVFVEKAVILVEDVQSLCAGKSETRKPRSPLTPAAAGSVPEQPWSRTRPQPALARRRRHPTALPLPPALAALVGPGPRRAACKGPRGPIHACRAAGLETFVLGVQLVSFSAETAVAACCQRAPSAARPCGPSVQPRSRCCRTPGGAGGGGGGGGGEAVVCSGSDARAVGGSNSPFFFPLFLLSSSSFFPTAPRRRCPCAAGPRRPGAPLPRHALGPPAPGGPALPCGRTG